MKKVLAISIIFLALAASNAWACPCYTPPPLPPCPCSELPCGTEVTLSGCVVWECPEPWADLRYFKAGGYFTELYEYDGHVSFPSNTGELICEFDPPLVWKLPFLEAEEWDSDGWFFWHQSEATFEDGAPFLVQTSGCYPQTLLELELYNNEGASEWSWCNGSSIWFRSYDAVIVGGLRASCFDTDNASVWLGKATERVGCGYRCYTWAWLDLRTAPCVPEPGAVVTLAVGLVALGGYGLSRRR